MNIYSRNIFAIMLALCMWHVAFAASPSKRVEGITEQQILGSLKAQDDALVRLDAAAFMSFLADDYTYSSEQSVATGKKLTKKTRSEFEASLAKNFTKINNYQISHADIKISISQDGRNATVTEKCIEKFTYDDKHYKIISLNTRTFGLQGGKITVTSSADLIQKAQAFSSASEFLRGEARLTCRSLACAASARWNFESNGLNNLFNNGKWQELADKIIEIGYPYDMFYLYLGVAAKVLGSNEAARIYSNYAVGRLHDPILLRDDDDEVRKKVAQLLAEIEAERLAEADELPARIEEAERLAEANRLAEIAEAERLTKAVEDERLAKKAAEAERLAKAAEVERLAEEERAAAKKAANAKKLNEL
jgi:hypothetical protein